MEIRRVGVVGCGVMGAGIAEVCARGGYEVTVVEVTDDLLARGLRRVEESMRRAVERGKITADEMAAARERIRGTTRLEDLAGADLVIEAVVERMDAKKEVFARLDTVCPPYTLFASNTSSLSITELASATARADRVLGLHFFNPVPVMKLVELIRGLQTSPQTAAIGRRFAESLGKTVVECRDSPGFIVNFLLVPYLLDAVRALERGIASRDDIDTAVVLGLAHPMGPLRLLDHVGLDTTYHIAEAMFAEFKDPRYAAPPLLKQMVAAGRLGRKSGKGFYDYEGGG
ncbi:MAG: 3-hydroxybutyryl-CoA dehydrogenase [Armatimonadota bacterium]|nr:3-hydroxybutyryl-CoA dehydrogenase [Armatimonadota bacterium]MDR7400645.1 3-hydroxybutyryl-CoA dehydrogenase [Armatimonadota bacterium]MDR7403173.1 3-hydroxybutyryl-CoA dehydrogenase [Armatimonadota bacterium]MDR7436544.1 3-hydroxybutyryl-CoA dehydrogenase [Armatimonadota bacterium]MDR7472579.1 3-hydroxybutyryl-CoA dehydrogenase [Armatimonadota bacterium]